MSDLERGIRNAVGDSGADPQALVDELCKTHRKSAVIEAVQQAFERGAIVLNSDGMVIPIGATNGA